MRRTLGRQGRLGALAALMIPTVPACVDISFPVDVALLDSVSPFVVRGTATVVDHDGPCPAWIGDNGVTYHLFQDPQLDNELFDRVTEPGTVSRLVLAERSDLELACRFGVLVEVQDVLEIIEP